MVTCYAMSTVTCIFILCSIIINPAWTGRYWWIRYTAVQTLRMQQRSGRMSYIGRMTISHVAEIDIM